MELSNWTTAGTKKRKAKCIVLWVSEITCVHLFYVYKSNKSCIENYIFPPMCISEHLINEVQL